MEASLEAIAQLRRAYVQLESTLGRRWSAEIFVTHHDLPVDLKAVYQAGKRCEQHRSETVNLAQLGQIKKDHDAALHHPKVVIEGAGPVGLLTAMKQYEAGADVTVLEKRSMDYERSQILRLDNQWVKELRYYLGSQFDRAFLSGRQGAIKSDGSIHIRTAELENALHDRLSELISFVDNGTAPPDIKRLAAHSIVDVSRPAEPGKRFVVNARYDQSYDSQFKGQRKDGTPTTPAKGLDQIEADILICAGGKNSSTREQFFNYAPVTEGKTFGVASWSGSSIENAKQDTFKKVPGVFTITPEFKQKCVASAEKELMALEAEFGRPKVTPDFYRHMAADFKAQLQGMGGDLATRHFENYQKAYIGMEVPQSFYRFLNFHDRGIDTALGGELDAKQLARVKGVARQVWFQSVADVGQEDQPNMSDRYKLDMSMMDPKFTSVFSAALDQNTETVAVIGAPDDKRKLLVFPAGDSATGPHFMTATGLTGGREDTGNQAEFTRKLCMLEDPLDQAAVEPLIESVRGKMKATSDFVIERGLGKSSAFPDDITPESLAAFKRRSPELTRLPLKARSSVSLKDEITKSSPGLTVVPVPGTGEDVFNVDMGGGKQFTLTVLDDGMIEAENRTLPGKKEHFTTFNNFKLTYERG